MFMAETSDKTCSDTSQKHLFSRSSWQKWKPPPRKCSFPPRELCRRWFRDQRHFEQGGGGGMVLTFSLQRRWQCAQKLGNRWNSQNNFARGLCFKRLLVCSTAAVFWGVPSFALVNQDESTRFDTVSLIYIQM